MSKVNSAYLNVFRKGGPGSGPHTGAGHAPGSTPVGTAKPGHDANSTGIHKPNERGHEYATAPSSRNPGKPRAGIRPSDLYPERSKPRT